MHNLSLAGRIPIPPLPSHHAFNNHTGKRFGRLTAIQFVGIHDVSNQAMWWCACTCGETKLISSSNLACGRIISCGCAFTEVIAARKAPNNGGSHKRIFAAYRANANARKLPFALSLEEFVSIAEKPCHYCGVPHSNILIRFNLSWKYNGIDRVDNTKGYESGNVVPCCRTCNIAKRTLSKTDFLEWAERLARFQLAKEKPFKADV